MPAFSADIRDRMVRVLDTFTCGVLAESERRVVFANKSSASCWASTAIRCGAAKPTT